MNLKNTIVLSLLAVVPFAAGCGDDGPKVPGSITALWALPGIATCADLNLKKLEMSALQKDEVIGSVTVTCGDAAKNGQISLGELQPGRYTVRIEGIDADDNATHAGMVDKVQVNEGSDTKFDEQKPAIAPLVLTQKPTSVLVDWDLGGKCSTKNVATVTVEVFDDTGLPLPTVPAQTVKCDNEVAAPDTGELESGVLFAGLAARQTVRFGAKGLDADKNVVLQGTSEKLLLRAGEVHKVVVMMTTP
ncbi:MAG: hypothetical protein R3F39_07770 [Myxococcota bacterium]